MRDKTVGQGSVVKISGHFRKTRVYYLCMNTLRLVFWLLGFKARAFEKATKDPIKAQERVLFEYLRRNKDTEFGRQHGFSGIGSVEEYRRRVPLGDGESFRPYIERIAKGESNVLTRDKTDFFAVTSGTTSKPKLIPSTAYSRSKKAEVTNLWAYYIDKDHPRIKEGKILALMSHEVEGSMPSGAPFGAESGHAYRNMPAAIRDFYALPYEVFEIEDYDARYYCMLRIAMEHDVTTVATLNPIMILLLCQRLPAVGDKVMNDIEKGTISRDFNISREVRTVLENGIRPNPARASELRRLAGEYGELLPKHFWPNMRLIECWKSGAALLYLSDLKHYFGDVPLRDLGYVSSEARASVTVSDEGAGGILAINTNFYEFIPKEVSRKYGQGTLLCDRLEEGGEYFIIVTTAGGLYRYDIDDIVKVTGFFNKTPVIEFVQKGGNAVSLAGEKLYGAQVNEAVSEAVRNSGLSIRFFSASPRFNMLPGYVFLVEFDDGVPFDSKKALLASIEEGLRHHNSEYKLIREKKMLSPPVLKVVRKGGFDKYRTKRLKEGAHDSQFKMPELTPDPDFEKNFEIEEVVKLDDHRRDA